MELDVPPLPVQLAHVWHWFLELSLGRTGSGFGLNALTWADMDAWARLTQRRMTREDITCLKALDAEYLKAMHHDPGERLQ